MLPQTEYLDRALPRLFEDQRVELNRSISAIRAKLASTGMYQSGNHLSLVKNEYDRVLKDSAGKAARLAFDAAGIIGAELLERHLSLFRTELSVELADYLGKTASWARGAERRLADEFHSSSVDLTRGYIDDFRHGILEGARLKSDPTLTITDSIVNSPGAVQQSGIGNAQNATTSVGSADDVRTALKDFLESPEVAGLSEDDRQSLFDLSELMVGELKEILPEPTRLARFGNYLLSAADRLGVAVAGQALSRAIFGG